MAIVPFDGPLNSPIAIVGEAPNAHDTNANPPLPFSGPVGNLLDTLLARAAIVRQDTRLMNVMCTRPPSNQFGRFWSDCDTKTKLKAGNGKIPTPELVQGIAHLKRELEKMPDLRVIVVLGRQPLYVLTGKDGIMKWRGSVMECHLDSGRVVKVVPTFHPSFLIHGAFTAWPWVVHDLQRAKIEAGYPEIRRRSRKYVVYPSDKEIKDFVRSCHSRMQNDKTFYLSNDIECYAGLISRVGLSDRIGYGISIPFYNIDSDTEMTGRQWIWDLIKPLLQTAPTIGQNFMFDSFWYWFKQGIDISRNIWHDTKIVQSGLLPGTLSAMKPLSLQCIVSMWTDPVEPYYKDEGAFTKTKRPTDEEYGIYSCKDADLTGECAINQRNDPSFQHRIDTIELMMNLIRGPIPDVMRRGVRFNQHLQQELLRRSEKECELLELLVAQEMGEWINLRSPTQVAKMLYDDLKLRAPVSRTTDKDQLISLSTQHPNKLPIVYTAKHRKISKISDNLFTATRKINTGSGQKFVPVVSNDGRIRCQYDPSGTKTGRLNCTTNPVGGGFQMHTVVRKDKHPQVRPMFMPDPGMYFVNADLAQAELRVVAYLARAMGLIALLNNASLDVHTEMAKDVLRLVRGHEIESVTYEERQLGKKNVHGSNYLMGDNTLVKTCRTELEINITRTQASQIRKGYLAAYPEIPIWHKSIEHELKINNMKLVTPLGREHVFYESYRDVLKSAVAFKPQSTVGDLLNIIWLRWEREHKYGDMLLTNHDSLAFQFRKEDIKPAVEEVKKAFHYPIQVSGMEMVIPVDITVSDVWEGRDLTEEVL